MNVTPATQTSLSLDNPLPGPADAEGARPFASEGETFQHYQVLRREDGSLWELGRGAMGVTYKAFDTNLRCHVALKVISAQYLHSETAGQRFIREARIAARVRHPNIAAVYHLGIDPQGFFYSMEFIDGETLESLVERVGPLPLATVLHIGLQVARALAAASRQGLIHRDIKPANLMVLHQDDEGEDRLLVKMIDFGLARSYAGDDSHPQLTATGFVGTPLFASPEQLEEKDLDVRSDIYSLGVTLWILLTGQPPFAGKMTQVITQHLHAPPPWWQLGECGDAVRGLLERMLDKNRLQRYQTATELRVAIESCLRCVTGKDFVSADGADLADAERSPARPALAKADASSRETVVDDAALPVSRLVGKIVGQPPRATGDVSVGQRLIQWKFPLLGIVAVALCVGGLVYWHGSSATANAAHPATPPAPKIVQAPVSIQPAPVPSVSATEPPAVSPNQPLAALATPVPSPPAAEPTPKSTDDKAPPPLAPSRSDDLAALDGSPASAPEALASPAPASSPAVADEHDTADNGPASTPAKNQSSAGHGTRSHRSGHAAPTPTPSFLQKLFGIKPKPKPKS